MWGKGAGGWTFVLVQCSGAGFVNIASVPAASLWQLGCGRPRLKQVLSTKLQVRQGRPANLSCPLQWQLTAMMRAQACTPAGSRFFVKLNRHTDTHTWSHDICAAFVHDLIARHVLK
jgi:hypothetical protein